jgi:hypothetical protein
MMIGTETADRAKSMTGFKNGIVNAITDPTGQPVPSDQTGRTNQAPMIE